jgi:hypothetical protein
MEALEARAEKEPNNPEAHHMIATYYWEKAQKDFTIPKEERMKFAKAGLQSVDKALQLKSDYLEAVVLKGCCSAPGAARKGPEGPAGCFKEADRHQRAQGDSEQTARIRRRVIAVYTARNGPSPRKRTAFFLVQFPGSTRREPRRSTRTSIHPFFLESSR